MGSGKKVWAALDVFTASDLNGYLMDQVTISCTSGTRPASPPDGMRIYETDTGSERSWSAATSTWVTTGSNRVTAIVPVLTATTTSPSLGSGSFKAGWWTRSQGNMIDFHWWVKFGTSGVNSGSGQYLFDLPVPALGVFGTAAPESTGSGLIRDDSAATLYQATTYIPGSNLSVVAMVASTGVLTHNAPYLQATLDYIQGSIRYRAAS